jgi:hypothetical protein
MPQRSRDTGNRDLVGAQCAREWMPFDPIDEIAPSANDSGLWSTKELVSAERDNGRAGRDCFADRWLVPQPEEARLEQRSAPEIFDLEQFQFVRQPH